MAAPDSSSRVSSEAAGRAVDALLKWMHARAKHQKAQLLEHDDFLYLVLTLKKIPPTGRTNPYRIPLPHPLYPFDDATDPSTSVCLFVDDRPKSPLPPSAASGRIASDSIPISNVIGLSDLRSDYRPFEARRRLCDSHDLFFADRRIIPLLPRLLGKHFFKKKKIPLAVDLSRPGWPEQIRQCCASTLLYLRTGTCSGLKVGRMTQARDEVVDNVMAAIAGAVEYVPRKWANVRSLHIKSVESLALPIYQAVPELGLKIEGFQKKELESKKEHFEGEVVQMEKAKEKSVGGSKRKAARKKGRIHEVQYMDTDPENGSGDDHEDTMQEDDGGEVYWSDELGTEKIKKKEKNGIKVKKGKIKKGKKDGNEISEEDDTVQEYNGEEENGNNELGLIKRVKKKQKTEADAKQVEKNKKISRHVPNFSGRGTTADGEVTEDYDHMHLDKGEDEKVSEEKRLKKAEKGKDKKGKRYGAEKKEDDDSVPRDDVQEEKVRDEPGVMKRMKKETEKDAVVEKETVKEDKTGNRDGSLLSNEAAVADGMKKSKTKKLVNKDVKKIKRSKVRQEAH